MALATNSYFKDDKVKKACTVKREDRGDKTAAFVVIA